MNKNDRVAIARLEEKVKSIEDKIENMHGDIREIAESTKHIRTCITSNKIKIATLTTKLNNHLQAHETGTRWIMFIPSLAAVIVAIIALAMRVGAV